MTSSMVAAQAAAPPTEKVWRPSRLSKLVAFLPLWFLLYMTLFVHTFSSPMMSRPPQFSTALAGGAIAQGLPLFWMLIGAYVLWGARSWFRVAVVYVLFTFPATMALMFGPAVVLILQNQS